MLPGKQCRNQCRVEVAHLEVISRLSQWRLLWGSKLVYSWFFGLFKSLPVIQVHFLCKCGRTWGLLDGCASILSYCELPKGSERLSKLKMKRWGITLCKKLRSEEVRQSTSRRDCAPLCHCVLADGSSSPGSITNTQWLWVAENAAA